MTLYGMIRDEGKAAVMKLETMQVPVCASLWNGSLGQGCGGYASPNTVYSATLQHGQHTNMVHFVILQHQRALSSESIAAGYIAVFYEH